MKPIHIKWVLAHEPIDIFIRAAEKFAEVVEARAPGQFEIEVLTLSEYADKYNHGERITKHNLLDLMDSGAIEMSQMYTYVLSKYNNDLDALDLPFLFRDHDHAARVFESDIGEGLLDGYTRNSNIRGMAFTYSGGFMNMPMNPQFRRLRHTHNIVEQFRHETRIETVSFILFSARQITRRMVRYYHIRTGSQEKFFLFPMCSHVAIESQVINEPAINKIIPVVCPI